jgi:transcriptional regulator with XRE-family HTH domain
MMNLQCIVTILPKIDKILNLVCFNISLCTGFFQTKFRYKVVSHLKTQREKRNLTQEKLAEKSGVSLRAIKQIESGIQPKGENLKRLAEALQVHEKLIQYPEKDPPDINYTVIKIMNLSSLPLSVLPPFNIAVPVFMMFVSGQFNDLAKQLVSLQIIWTLLSYVIFMLSAFSRVWIGLNRYYLLAVIVFLVLTNVAIILINAVNLDENEKPLIRLNFSVL